MNVKRKIQIVDSKGSKSEAIISGYLDTTTRECHIQLSYGEVQLQGLGMNFFEAFCRVREQLQNSGLLPICYGACRNVWPSGMLADMCLGIFANVLEDRSKPAGEVDIFDSGSEMDLVSVEEQKAFARSFFVFSKPTH